MRHLDALTLAMRHGHSRRTFLRMSGLGSLGLAATASQAADAPAVSLPAGSKIRSCILLFYYGGPSHIDTWDMKLDAPSEVRGIFQPIATSAGGIQVCEHLPHTARVMHHVALLRGMHHPMRNHNAAAVEALCGRTPAGGDQELLADDKLSFPCYGSALSYMLNATQPLELPHVALPHVMYNVVQLPGQTSGFLGSAFERFQIEGDPNSPQFNVGSLRLPDDVAADRLTRRASLMHRLGGPSAEEFETRDSQSVDDFYNQAFSLLRSETVRQTLDISQESDATRDMYGRNSHGQSVLLARRLAESGVRFVTVFNGVHNGQDANWDSHQLVFPRHKDHLLPPADQAYAALLTDLEQRGLLETTLVVALGEFGRTPRINGVAGRDHWPDCFTVLLAGGGVKGGYVHGSSDAIGAYPDTDGVTPGDLAATIHARFGLDPASEIHDITGRPYRLADGKPIEAVMA